MRHRFAIWDTSVILAATGLLVFLAAEYHLLVHSGLSRADAAGIELAEVAIIAAVLGAFLLVAIRRGRAQARELRRRIVAEARAHELAFQDPLTGLPNRRQFDESVMQAVESPPGADRAHAILMLDLNGFKFINDTHGHPIGDIVLKEVGTRLAAIVRETGDHVARLGGDEFGIVATHVRGAEDANGIALRIIDVLRAPIESGEGQHVVGAGVGIALYPRDGSTAEEIVRRADVALYRAKSEPGCGIRFFEQEMDAHIRERALVEAELRRAIRERAIRPYYQPIVELGTDKIVGFEALARWHHATMGEVAPERFMPVAEACGLMSELGDHLLRTACRDACSWPANTTLAFNVSPVQLRNPTFGLRVMAILGETGLAPSRLELEITENTLVRDLKIADEVLGSLRAAGVRVALDDFGTGYSSLYHLKKFKFDRIKIDRSFVESMVEESQSATIVRALLGLGHGLGVSITAEGIERGAQKDALVGEGCDHGQGFLFSRAMSASDAAALFEDAGRPAGHSLQA